MTKTEYMWTLDLVELVTNQQCLLLNSFNIFKYVGTPLGKVCTHL